MKDLMEEIEVFVKKEMESMSPYQIRTLEALLCSGYRGERERVLKGLLKKLGVEEVSSSPLVESFFSRFDEEDEVIYWRIKPEFYRSVRKHLTSDLL